MLLYERYCTIYLKLSFFAKNNFIKSIYRLGCLI
jgi:hypothetical protein